jgi:hypothetical protein
MQRILAVAALTAALSLSASAQSAKAFLGRWDMTATPATGAPYPQWMELSEKDGKLTGRVQPRGGGWRPIAGATVTKSGLIVAVAAATARTPAISWELTSPKRGELAGLEKRGDQDGPKLAGVRAPKLDRRMPKAWGEPQAIFNGKDLTGWEPFGNNVKNNKWVVRDGELINDNPQVAGQRGPGGANLKTTAKFQDFKLHIEVNCPDHGNSGIYLRGRYEIQIGTEGGSQPDHEMGAVYSHYPPPAGAELNLGKWTSFDITLVGRRVTVLRDGKVYHDNVEIPGPTGGALDSREAEPGPFFLQGDHYGVIRYRNITVAEPKK